ncbi:hypothetical Protein YC6258_00448 [Gynuella sunshinyii YC6258]|uniref:DUF3500 domain-containing protein n=1 Tax=Gynuella sunshinyii YC6258 TaxID=1445510 RepID=A0A0C5VGF9_9GAMM|nr:hypothetical Protein YC6258_00448 [Gynuella sunshinyii YC6258]
MTVGDCAADSDLETIVCTAQAFFDTLTTSEYETVILDWGDAEAKTTWSNLPNASRNGLMFGNLSEEARLAAMTVAKAVLTDEGYDDFLGVLAADDYLNEQGGAGGGTGTPPDGDAGTPPDGSGMPSEGGSGGLTYSSDNYYIAFIGEPSVSGDWMLQIGGHHLAYNVTFLSGSAYPVPNHIGVEPKSAFEINSATYAPLADEGDAMVAMFDALDKIQLAEAYLQDQSYSDVLMGPDNGSATLPTDYPTGMDREGILVSTLSDTQKSAVIEAIKAWVEDYSGEISAPLMEEYASDIAFNDTYIAWSGDESAGVDVDIEGTYMRIDGPRLWIEIVCQAGVILSGTHYHTMFRDKSYDYGNSL